MAAIEMAVEAHLLRFLRHPTTSIVVKLGLAESPLAASAPSGLRHRNRYGAALSTDWAVPGIMALSITFRAIARHRLRREYCGQRPQSDSDGCSPKQPLNYTGRWGNLLLLLKLLLADLFGECGELAEVNLAHVKFYTNQIAEVTCRQINGWQINPALVNVNVVDLVAAESRVKTDDEISIAFMVRNSD